MVGYISGGIGGGVGIERERKKKKNKGKIKINNFSWTSWELFPENFLAYMGKVFSD